MYLLLGHAQDPCCAGVSSRLAARGLTARIVQDPLAPPATLTWRLDGTGLTSRLSIDPVEEAVDGIFVRDPGWLDSAGWDPDDYAYMQAEVRAVLLAWLAGIPCPVINRPDARQWYRAGASLFAWRSMLRRSGLPLPEAVITSDATEADVFRRQLATRGAGGAVFSPLSHSSAYLLASDDAWQGIRAMQRRTPVCLTEPHGAPTVACVVGDEVFWNDGASPAARALEAALLRFASAARLTFVEIAIAEVHRGLAVVLVDPRPRLEHFDEITCARILDALVAALAGTRAAVAAAPLVPS
jgi:hypothetical protein